MDNLKYKNQIAAAAGSVVIWVTIGVFVFHSLENWTWIESLYFSVVTLTTIGYGDLHPTTDVSRLITVFYILFGVVAVISAISIIGSWRIDKRAVHIKKRKDTRTNKKEGS